MICDQVFRYYEPAGTKSSTIVTNFIQPVATEGANAAPHLDQCQIMSSNPKINVKITPDDELEVSVKNGKSMTCQRSLIFIYADEFRSKLLGAAKVEIHACNLVTILVKAGEE